MSASPSLQPASGAGLDGMSAVLPFGRVPSIDNTYGALLLGTFLGFLLYGITLNQAYQYAQHHLTDSFYTKCFVVFVVLLDTFYTIQSLHMSYWYLVTSYFRPDRLFTGVWSINLFPVTTALSVIYCQCFFAHRVYAIGRRLRPLVALAGVMFLVEFGIAIAGTVEAFVLPNLTEFKKIAWTNSAGFAVAIVADIMLTAVLVWVLHRSRTGFRQTNSTIDVLIAYSVTTGLITDIFSIICLIMALVGPGDLVYAGFDIVCTKLYVNCVLAALNSRQTDADVFVPPADEENNAGVVKLPVPQVAMRPSHSHDMNMSQKPESISSLIPSDGKTEVFPDVIHIKPS